MYAVKTALRESFDNIHVGLRYNSIDENIKIEIDRGKIGWGKDVTYFYIPHFYVLLLL